MRPGRKRNARGNRANLRVWDATDADGVFLNRGVHGSVTIDRREAPMRRNLVILATAAAAVALVSPTAQAAGPDLILVSPMAHAASATVGNLLAECSGTNGLGISAAGADTTPIGIEGEAYGFAIGTCFGASTANQSVHVYVNGVQTAVEYCEDTPASCETESVEFDSGDYVQAVSYFGWNVDNDEDWNAATPQYCEILASGNRVNCRVESTFTAGI